MRTVATAVRSAQNAAMGHRRERDGLRGILYAVDVRALMGALNDAVWPEDALQLMGDAVLVVVGERADALEPAGCRCAAALRDRGWEGDDELADQIEALLGVGATPFLKSLAVDVEELAGILEGDAVMGGGRIDLRTGEVWPRSAIEYFEEVGERDPDDQDDQRWLDVACEGSRASYRDMEVFIDTLGEGRVADRLARAIQGRGAFRRFKDVLAETDGLLARWYGFSDDRHRGRARAWLADQGYAPIPARPDTDA